MIIERTIKSDKIYQGKIINLRVDTVELPDKKYSKREVVEHPGAAAIVPITKDNKIVMVKQFRKAVEDFLLEIPAGKLEIGEDCLECGKRELLEETGYKCEDLEYLLTFYTSPGFSNEVITIYVARNLQKYTENPDEDEYIEIEEYEIEELVKMIEESKIKDGKTIVAILAVKQFLKL